MRSDRSRWLARIGAWAAVCACCWALAPSTCAQATRPAAYRAEINSATATIVALADALEDPVGKAERLRGLIWTRPGSTSQSLALEALLDYLVQRHRLVAAASQKFGPEARARLGSPLRMVFGQFDAQRNAGFHVRAALAKAQFSFDATTARVLLPGETSPIVLRGRLRGDPSEPAGTGSWQIVIRMIDSLEDMVTRDATPPEPDRRVQVLDAQVRALEQVCSAIREGKYKSLAELEADLATRLALASPRSIHRPDVTPEPDL